MLLLTDDDDRMEEESVEVVMRKISEEDFPIKRYLTTKKSRHEEKSLSAGGE